MAKFLNYVCAAAVVWLVFTAGYLCRNVLGDWLFEAHTGSVATQVWIVSTGLFRVFLTFILVAVCGSACTGVAFAAAAVFSELWYQFFHRKIVAMLARAKQRRDEELMAAAEDGDDEEGVAPKRSVRPLRHARRGPGVRKGDKSGRPVRPLSERLRELSEQAHQEEAAEDSIENSEIKVTIRES